MPKLLFAKEKGEWLDFFGLDMLGRLGDELVIPEDNELIPLPEGATLTMVPGRVPIGVDMLNEKGRICSLTYDPYKLKNKEDKEKVWAVAALLPQGYTRTLLPAITDMGEPLPLLGYTAVGIMEDGQLVAAAVQTDEHKHWHPKYYNTADLNEHIAKVQEEFPNNSIIKQLALCSLEYGCFTAQNMFYRRWEAGLPVSPQCNAACVGCISLQEAECCPSPQRRITSAPKVEEVAEIAIAHLQQAEDAIVSFGQGCEGEPSLQADLIARVIREIRAKTARGTININTNAGYYIGMAKIMAAGIDSLRVSMISAVPENYAKYHRPCNYSFADVEKSLELAQKLGIKVALNLLFYPGFNDRVTETEALVELVKKYGVKQIQIRNLNIDPTLMTQLYGSGESLGVIAFLQTLKANLPDTEIGSYSKTVK
jgi:pyruvate-formate lyase-activating enzyme